MVLKEWWLWPVLLSPSCSNTTVWLWFTILPVGFIQAKSMDILIPSLSHDVVMLNILGHSHTTLTWQELFQASPRLATYLPPPHTHISPEPCCPHIVAPWPFMHPLSLCSSHKPYHACNMPSLIVMHLLEFHCAWIMPPFSNPAVITPSSCKLVLCLPATTPYNCYLCILTHPLLSSRSHSRPYWIWPHLPSTCTTPQLLLPPAAVTHLLAGQVKNPSWACNVLAASPLTLVVESHLNNPWSLLNNGKVHCRDCHC